MAVTYTVVQSTEGLTTTELNVYGASNLDLITIIDEDVGYRYIFYDVGAPVTFLSVYDYEGLTETELQTTYGDNDWQLITTLQPDVGIYYIFKDVS